VALCEPVAPLHTLCHARGLLLHQGVLSHKIRPPSGQVLDFSQEKGISHQ
jgi:hypothetical protein